MHLYKTTQGNLLVHNNTNYLFEGDWDVTINQENLYQSLLQQINSSVTISDDAREDLVKNAVLAPIGTQEVWAAGVTYLKSRDARMEESKESGGADCYQKVYEAERPELFFKALPQRVSGHGGFVNIRKDSTWNVPEPELTLYINSKGNIQAYTIGNDMSSRSIEGENPLYLPQAKVYERSAALGPCLYIPDGIIDPETGIHMQIYRGAEKMFDDSTTVSRLKRTLPELAGYLFKECDFPSGSFLMTGTCLVPGNDFTLQEGDKVMMQIDGIGTMTNIVSIKK